MAEILPSSFKAAGIVKEMGAYESKQYNEHSSNDNRQVLHTLVPNQSCAREASKHIKKVAAYQPNLRCAQGKLRSGLYKFPRSQVFLRMLLCVSDVFYT